MSGFGRVLLVGAVLTAGAGVAGLRAQTVLGDPRDAARTFSSNCSACHKSPQGLAKSGQVAGFLRQHYTTGPEMSAAMAAYLVAAGAGRPDRDKDKKTAAAQDSASAAKAKSKKGEQLAAQTPAERAAEAAQQRTLRGKQRNTKQHEPEAPAHVAPTAVQPAPDENKPVTEPAVIAVQPQTTVAPAVVAAAPQTETAPAVAASPSQPAPMVLDIPLPAMPEGPPSDLTQSVFASSPLP